MSLPLISPLASPSIAAPRAPGLTLGARLRRGAVALAREPLLHFILLGALLNLAGALWKRPAAAPRNARIEIPASQVGRLREVWSLQWHRQPTPAELQGLIDDYVREEVLSREAIALGLDRNDDIVRRRLIDKMEFLSGNPGAKGSGMEEGAD
jgi:hypothetical protein